jgi:nanoRNase/pAp phosphatase (c-di-AMP/oligoRNAs hydrolase)
VRSQSVSLRRSPGFDVDLSKIAEALGGGGHPAAAGATVSGITPALGNAVADEVARALRARG